MQLHYQDWDRSTEVWNGMSFKRESDVLSGWAHHMQLDKSVTLTNLCGKEFTMLEMEAHVPKWLSIKFPSGNTSPAMLCGRNTRILASQPSLFFQRGVKSGLESALESLHSLQAALCGSLVVSVRGWNILSKFRFVHLYNFFRSKLGANNLLHKEQVDCGEPCVNATVLDKMNIFRKTDFALLPAQPAKHTHN